MALAVELFKAQGFAVAGLVADGEATEACQLGEIVEASWIHDEGDEEMSADDTDPGNGLQVVDFGKGPTGLKHKATGLMLVEQSLVHGLIKQSRLGLQQVMRQLLEPALAVGG
jgi:hypothetical protein